MQAKLIPLDDGPTIDITKDVTIVGRKKGICDLVIDHPSISKLHCIVARTDGLLFIRDLGSTNGTKVNGQRVLRGAILPGDELAFAKVRFKVFLGPDVPAQIGSQDVTEVSVQSPPATESHEFRFLDEDDDADAEEVIKLIDDDDD